MKLVWAIIKKEFSGYFYSPIAFIFLVIFLMSQMGFTFILGRFYDSNNATLEIFFTFHPWLYLFLIPAIGMRLWAEEKREGTIELLFTLPVSLPQLILGKFLASWLFLLIALVLIFPIVVTIFYLGAPDPGPMFTGYFASWLMAGAFLSVTCLTSALTKNQVISFVLAVIACFALVLLGYGVFQQYLSFLPLGFSEFLANLGFIPHFQKAMRGLIDFRDLVYFASIIFFFLVLNAAVLDNRIATDKGLKRKSLVSMSNILILFIALLSVNFIVSRINIKFDFTSENLYTLSDGSRKIVKDIDDEATIKYFFSSSNEGLPVMIKNYGKRVEELLEEFAGISSNLSVETYDPKPDSDEEEMASKYGIQGVQANIGEAFYMGAAVLYRNNTYKVPFFDPRKESFLEYEIASMLANLKSSGGKKRLGLLAGFELSPPRLPPNLQKQAPKDDWLFVKELEKTFEVSNLDSKTEEIPANIDLLLVLHPQGFDDKAEYAIEQFILHGGKTIIAVDPSSKSVPAKTPSPYQAYGMQQSSSSDLRKVFSMLEIEYDAKRVVADDDHSTRVGTQAGPVRFPYWLSLEKDSFNSEMILTNQLKSALFVESGFFTLKSNSSSSYTSLISSGNNSGAIATQRLNLMQPQDFGNYDKINKALSLAGVVKGKFKTAFKEKPKDSKYPKAHLSEAKNENSVMLIGDIDFLNNRYALREMSFFGQSIVQPINQNITFLANALEFISGSPELISIRSRGKFSRPFDKVQEIEKEAQAKWLNVEKNLTMQIQGLQQKLNSLENEKTKDNKLVLSSAQQEEIRRFKSEQMNFKRKRREVRKNLRQDIERLGTQLTALNITIVPILVLIFGLYVYYKRSRGLSVFRRRKANV